MSNDPVMATIGKENFNLIELAVKCKFLSADQEREILYLFFRKAEDDPKASLVELLKELKFLSEEQIDFLFAVKNHIKVQQKDKKFGHIAVANRFTDSGKVEKALDQQARIFRETKSSRKIGDIMVENRDISEKDKTAVLLYQDRIEDEYLYKAFETIADSKLEAFKMEKRFGAIAARMGYASVEDVNRALKIQRAAEKEGGRKTYIGEILKDMVGLTGTDINAILKKQKAYVKRIFNLEKALRDYSSSIRQSRRLNDLFDCAVVNNRLEAVLSIKKRYSETPDSPGLYNWLNLSGIRYGLVEEPALKEFLDNGVPGASMTVALGEPPLPGRDGSAEFYFDTGFQPDPDAKDSGGDIPHVEKGDLVAEITPPEPGVRGKDVLGNTVSPPEPEQYHIQAGEGVSSADGLKFYAETDGMPVLYKGRTLFVKRDRPAEAEKVIEGDFTPLTRLGHDLYNLEIKGSVQDNAVVNCNTLIVGKDVKGHINAAGDVRIKGGAGKSLEEDPLLKRVSRIDAAGGVTVSRKLENTDVTSAQVVNASNSDVVSCTITAVGGIYVKNVMSNKSRPARLEIRHPLNDRLSKVRRQLREKREKLRALNFEKEMETINLEIDNQLNLQQEYKEKIRFLNSMAESAGSGDFPETDGAGEAVKVYLSDLLESFRGKSGEQVLDILEKEAELNRGFHRSSVKAYERLEKERKAKRRFVRRKREESADAVKELNNAIRDLLAEQDSILMKKERQPYIPDPEIKVKNRISKGTVVKGLHSSTIIENTMYGVKLTEKKSTDDGKWEMRVSGYYD